MIGLVDASVRHGQHAQVESLAREALAGYEKTRPENWRRCYAQSLLGVVLAGQNRFAKAEPLLRAAHKGLIERQMTIPAADRSVVTLSRDRILVLYRDWGQPKKAADWQASLVKG